MKTKLSIRWIALFLASACAIVAASSTTVSCGGGGSANSGGTGGMSTIVGPASSSSTTTGSSSSGGSTNTSTSSSGSGAGGGSCTDADAGNCYSCPPMTNTEFLNACNGMTCQPYDNSIANLPMLTADGGLPPITM